MAQALDRKGGRPKAKNTPVNDYKREHAEESQNTVRQLRGGNLKGIVVATQDYYGSSYGWDY